MPTSRHLGIVLSITVVLTASATKIDDNIFKYMNTSVDPCEDFYEYTCGNFKNENPRPDDFPMWDTIIILEEEIHNLVKEILEMEYRKNDPDALRKSKMAYKACMDTAYMERLEIPEMGILRKTGNWPLIADPKASPDFSWDLVADLIAEYGVPLFFDVEIMPDLWNAVENIIYIGPDPVLNPGIHQNIKEYSVDFISNFSRVKSKHPFEAFMERIAKFLRDSLGTNKFHWQIEKDVPGILDFMVHVQRGGIKDDKYPMEGKTLTVKELQDWVDEHVGKEINLNWIAFLNRIFSKSGKNVFPNTTVTIMDNSVFYGVLNLISKTEKHMLKNFVMTRLFTYTSPDSRGEILDAYTQFRIDMNDAILNRSDYCSRKVMDYPTGIGLAMALTYEYQRYYFNINKMQHAGEMVDDLQHAFTEILYESDWLDKETREKALHKANNTITLLGYPDFVENPVLLNQYYSNLRICAWDHFGNAQRLRSFRYASNYALLGPRNREIWQLSPLTVNAYYNAQNNRIIFPISMLHEIFYTATASVLDYARVGSIIGHEITHGFDNEGKLYDGDGTFTYWWSQQTEIEFNKRKQCFIDQYAKYYLPEIDEYVNSRTTVRENIADNGGLREAFKAFQRLKLRYNVVKSNTSHTPEQYFFIGYGNIWCTQQSNDYLKNRIQKSSYSPARYRVIGSVSNNQDFAKAFNCPVGSKMNPAEKCILW